MELLDLIVELAGLPKNEVLEDLVKKASQLGYDPESLGMNEIREILSLKLKETLGEVSPASISLNH